MMIEYININPYLLHYVSTSQFSRHSSYHSNFSTAKEEDISIWNNALALMELAAWTSLLCSNLDSKK